MKEAGVVLDGRLFARTADTEVGDYAGNEWFLVPE